MKTLLSILDISPINLYLNPFFFAFSISSFFRWVIPSTLISFKDISLFIITFAIIVILIAVSHPSISKDGSDSAIPKTLANSKASLKDILFLSISSNIKLLVPFNIPSIDKILEPANSINPEFKEGRAPPVVHPSPIDTPLFNASSFKSLYANNIGPLFPVTTFILLSSAYLI
ncbi:hypothetical protein D3C76_952370 [compost metagenome]